MDWGAEFTLAKTDREKSELDRGGVGVRSSNTLINMIDESLARLTTPNTTPLMTSGSFADL
jgi:hypothetical protein